jgi:hypothetical protein
MDKLAECTGKGQTSPQVAEAGQWSKATQVGTESGCRSQLWYRCGTDKLAECTGKGQTSPQVAEAGQWSKATQVGTESGCRSRLWYRCGTDKLVEDGQAASA